MTPTQLLGSGAYGTMSPICCSCSRGERGLRPGGVAGRDVTSEVDPSVKTNLWSK